MSAILENALRRAASIMAGRPYVGEEKLLARALLELWQVSNVGQKMEVELELEPGETLAPVTAGTSPATACIGDVRFKERPKCIYESRAGDGSNTGGGNMAWCRTHGFDCPNNR